MVFWSGFIKKIKNGVNQLAFEALKTKVETIETTYGTITYIDTKNNELRLLIVDNTNDITQIKNELKLANFVIYKGNWNGGITYRTGEAITYNNKWYVSNVDNNINHIPTGASDQYWELISEPTINLNDYYTKIQADAKFALIGESYTKTQSDQKYALLSNTYTKTDADAKFALKTSVGATIYDYEITIPDGTRFQTGQKYSYVSNTLQTGLKILNACPVARGYNNLNYNGTWTWFYNDRNGQFGIYFTSNYDWTANGLVFSVYAAKENVKVITKTAS